MKSTHLTNHGSTIGDIYNPYDWGPMKSYVSPPREVDLEYTDIPPSSVIRRIETTPDCDTWCSIQAVNKEGVALAGDVHLSYAEMRNLLLINRPKHRDADGNPTLWEPCSKTITEP